MEANITNDVYFSTVYKQLSKGRKSASKDTDRESVESSDRPDVAEGSGTGGQREETEAEEVLVLRECSQLLLEDLKLLLDNVTAFVCVDHKKLVAQAEAIWRDAGHICEAVIQGTILRTKRRSRQHEKGNTKVLRTSLLPL